MLHTQQLFTALLNILLYLRLFNSWISDVHSVITLIAHANFGTGSVFLSIQEEILAEVTSTYFFFYWTQTSPLEWVPLLWMIFFLRFHPTVQLSRRETWHVLSSVKTQAHLQLNFMLWILSLLLPSAFRVVWNFHWLFCLWKSVFVHSCRTARFLQHLIPDSSSFVSCLFTDPSP